jgi:hypothetical protein
MEAEWYYQVMGTVIGPLTADEIRWHAVEGRLADDTLVRKGATGHWVTADRVKGLFTPPPPRTTAVPSSEVDAKQQRIEEKEPSRLRPCPDCRRDVSTRAVQCPHCGCPCATVDSTFAAVVAAFAQAIGEFGYVIQVVDKENGLIQFKTGPSWFSFGQDFSMTVVDNGDGTFGINYMHRHGQLLDWGEGRDIVHKVTRRVVYLLKSQGLSDCIR